MVRTNAKVYHASEWIPPRGSPETPGRCGVIVVSVRVHPGASREAVVMLEDGSLDVRVRARAVEGKANEGVVEVLADRLGLRKRDVRIATGARSRQKVVELELPSREELHRRLGAGS